MEGGRNGTSAFKTAKKPPPAMASREVMGGFGSFMKFLPLPFESILCAKERGYAYSEMSEEKRKEPWDMKVILDGNAFYEIDEECMRQKEAEKAEEAKKEAEKMPKKETS